MTGKERVLHELRLAGSFGLTSDELDQKCGIRRASARVKELRDAGHTITGGFVDKKRGIYRYRLVSLAPSYTPPAEPEPDDFTGALFPDEQAPTHPQNAIDDDWSHAA